MTSEQRSSWRKPMQATRAIFLVNGMAIGAWAPMVPIVKTRLNLDDGSLGLLLLAMGIGGLITMPFSGPSVALKGYRFVILLGFVISTTCLAALAIAPNFVLMFAALFVFGSTMGLTDVSMNLQAAQIEQQRQTPIMSGFHGMWSVGAFIGASLMALLLSAGIELFFAALIIIALCFAIIWPMKNAFLTEKPAQKGDPLFVVPKGLIILLGVLCFILYFTEHAILDWGAVFMNTVRGVPLDQAGFAYTFFAASMTIMRFSGDTLRKKLGDGKMMLIGGFLGALGYYMIALINNIWLDYLGFAIAGAGLANLVPIIFSAAGRTKIMPPHLALASVATVSFAGLLLGPGIVGFIAQATNLTFSFMFLGSLLLLVGACYKIFKRI